MSTFFTGEFEIPPFAIRYQLPDGSTGEVFTSPILITVRSLTPEEFENLDIRDIKEPVLLRGNSRAWIIYSILGGLIVMAALAYWLWKYWKNKGKPAFVPPPLPAHEQALQALTALRGRTDLIEEQRYKEFSTIVSEIIRKYISHRWAISAMDETTEEVLGELKKLRLSDTVFQSFETFFFECDLMKFAKHTLPQEDLVQLIDLAESIVLETKEPFSQPTEPAAQNEESEPSKEQEEQKQEITQPVGEP